MGSILYLFAFDAECAKRIRESHIFEVHVQPGGLKFHSRGPSDGEPFPARPFAIAPLENTGFTPSRLNTRCVRFSRAATTEGRRRVSFNPIRFQSSHREL
jgi:hypothetical protein